MHDMQLQPEGACRRLDVARTYGVDPAVICRLAKLTAPSAPPR
jgi:hypothetical protein